MKRPARFLVLLAVLLFSYGCTILAAGVVGVGVGAGTYKYIEGSLGRDYPVEYSQALESTNTALENLQISLASSDNQGTKGRIEGVTQGGKKVVVKITDKSQGVSYISVRVGRIGNREAAERIHDEIAAIAGI
jgi:hypothetical protein